MNQRPRPLRIVIFDLDGVLVPIDSSWQHVHRAFGRNNEIDYRRYLKGEIDYQQFMRSDIALWGNPPIQAIQAILDKIPLTDGAREVSEALREKNIRIAIISSGISLLADRVGRELAIDHVHSNKLVIDDEGHLTGEGITEVPLNIKSAVIRRILKEERIPASEAVVVGDSSFDFPPSEEIGLSIAFNPQDEESRRKADLVVEGKDLRLLLPWLTRGIPNKIMISIQTEEGDSSSITSAISTDNFKVPEGLYINICHTRKRICVKIVSVRGLGTLLATVDDILSCAQVAAASIDTIRSFSDG